MRDPDILQKFESKPFLLFQFLQEWHHVHLFYVSNVFDALKTRG